MMTYETFLLRGLHSIMLTLSPSFVWKQGGECAAYLLVRFSYLSNLGRNFICSLSTITVPCIFVEMTSPLRMVPLTESAWFPQLFGMGWDGLMLAFSGAGGFFPGAFLDLVT